MSLQLLENKVLSRGIIGKSAPLLAEITIRKSQITKNQNPEVFEVSLPASENRPIIGKSEKEAKESS